MPLQALPAQVCLLDLFHPISRNRSNQLNWQRPAVTLLPRRATGPDVRSSGGKTQLDAAAQCAPSASDMNAQFIKAVAHHANCA